MQPMHQNACMRTLLQILYHASSSATSFEIAERIAQQGTVPWADTGTQQRSAAQAAWGPLGAALHALPASGLLDPRPPRTVGPAGLSWEQAPAQLDLSELLVQQLNRWGQA